MGRIIAAVSLTGWAAIAWIAWQMADRRINVACGAILQQPECLARMERQRDFILTVGLTGALVIIVASLTVYSLTARRRARPIASRSGWSPTNRGQQTRLR